MRHAVLGAGGVGGLVAGALSRAGKDVTLLVRPEALASQPPSLRVESAVLGDFEALVAAAARLEAPVDVLWVTVKATQLEAALAGAPADRLGDGLVIPLLNGVDHLGRLREVYGPGRVAAGAIRVESERVAPGHIVQSSPFVALELASASDELRQRLEAVAEELGQAGLACRVSDDEMGVLWAKLAVLCPFALVSAASGLDLGGIREDPAWRDRLSGCAEELRAVAAALGVEVDSAGGALLERGPATMRTSMQKDVAAGRPPELEAIAGPVIRGGEATGVDVPTTRELADAVRRRAAT